MWQVIIVLGSMLIGKKYVNIWKVAVGRCATEAAILKWQRIEKILEILYVATYSHTYVFHSVACETGWGGKDKRLLNITTYMCLLCCVVVVAVLPSILLVALPTSVYCHAYTSATPTYTHPTFIKTLVYWQRA